MFQFSFEDCKFKIQKNKEGAGRVVMWMMGICNSYTMEASFCGTIMSGARSETHFSTQDFELMGRSFCQTLLDYYDDDPRKVLLLPVPATETIAPVATAPVVTAPVVTATPITPPQSQNVALYVIIVITPIALFLAIFLFLFYFIV